MIENFNELTCEQLGYYVYALVDPRDGKIFYIGKGMGNRVFQHLKTALEDDNEDTLKIKTIKEILASGNSVRYYIIRYGLKDPAEAYRIESTLIDFLTYPAFNLEKVLTNIASGHHQWDEGIKSAEEINALYNCPPIEIRDGDYLLLVSLNKSYDQAKAEGVYQRTDIYECTRKYWLIGKNKPAHITHVVGVYRGVVRSVIKVEGFEWVTVSEDGFPFKKERCCFNGRLINDSPYLNKTIPPHTFGSGSAIAYLPKV